MSTQVGFVQRLLSILVPTPVQVLFASCLSVVVLLISQSSELLKRLGITNQAISASQDQFHDHFDALLRSSVASHIALMTFWALVGLVAYLICWGIYNALIAARNEVTLAAAYTNRGHWRGPYETLAVKSVAGLGLAVVLSAFWAVFSFWLVLVEQAIRQITPTNSVLAVLAFIGFAAQLYIVLVFAQLTFTPWYRAESFTDA